MCTFNHLSVLFCFLQPFAVFFRSFGSYALKGAMSSVSDSLAHHDRFLDVSASPSFSKHLLHFTSSQSTV